MLKISSRFFTWDLETGCFSGEASELERELSRQSWTRLDYRDGQWGFTMVSERTGTQLWFQRVSEERDREGELTAVVFHALAPKTPWGIIKLRVFND